MKKKLVLVVAVLVITITACALLAGCAPKNPGEFLEKWLDASTKSMVMEGVEMTIDGNIACSKVKREDAEMVTYIEIDKDNVIMYNGMKMGETMTWRKMTMTKAQAKEMMNLEKDITSINDLITNQLEFNADDFKDFDKNFTKKDGAYVGNKDTDYEGVTLKLSAKEMTMTIGEGEEGMTISYKIGGSKITIPQEAKDAEEMEY